MRKFLIAVGALAAVAAPSIAGGVFYQLGVGRTPWGVTNGGAVASGMTGAEFFHWTPEGGYVGVGGAPNAGQARISNDGTRFSGMAVNPATGLREMAYYDRTAAAWTLLGGIGGASGSETSSGWGISGNGRTVVGLGWVSAGSAHAIQWNEGGATFDVGSTVAGRSSRANGADFDGNTVVGWQDGATGFRQGAVWRNGVQSLIWQDAAQTIAASEAGDVSADGNWVVGLGNFDNGQQPWRWSESTGFQSLGHLNPAWRASATAVSDDGARVVGFDRPFPGPPTFGQGFIWTAETGMVNLNTYVAGLGIDTNGVTLSLPLAISPDGYTIAGLSTAGGWVVVLPEPSTLSLLAIAALTLRRRG